MPSAPLQFLVDHGPTLAAGVTALLANGAVLLLLLRSPVHRQRVGELTLLAALVWLLLACVPLPRLSFTANPAPALDASIPSPNSPAGILAIPADIIYHPHPAATDTPPVPAITSPLTDYRPHLAAAYLAGAAACAAWLALGHACLRRAIRRATPAPDRLARFLASRIRDGHRRPRLLLTDRIARPVTCGLLRPTILLPARLADPALDAQVRQVLLHELAHVRHRDAWGAALFCVALPLLYAHPLYWWLRRRVHLARELVADDAAARADGKDVYAAHLVDFARAHLSATRPTAAGAVAIFERPSDFYRRMHMLLQRTAPLPTRCSTPSRLLLAVTWLAAVALAACLAGVRPAAAQDAPRTINPDNPHPSQLEDEREELRAQMEALKARQKQLEERLARAHEKAARTDRDTDAARTKAERAEQDALIRADKEAVARAQRTKKEAATRRETTTPFADTFAPPTQPPPAKRAPTPAEAPVPLPPVPSSDAPAGARIGGVQLDLISLADRLVDASGAVKLAKARLDRIAALKGLTSAEERTTAEVNLETATARLDLLRSIAKVALQSAQQELALAEKQTAAGLAPVERAAEARTKLEMLELILSRTN